MGSHRVREVRIGSCMRRDAPSSICSTPQHTATHEDRASSRGGRKERACDRRQGALVPLRPHAIGGSMSGLLGTECDVPALTAARPHTFLACMS